MCSCGPSRVHTIYTYSSCGPSRIHIRQYVWALPYGISDSLCMFDHIAFYVATYFCEGLIPYILSYASKPHAWMASVLINLQDHLLLSSYCDHSLIITSSSDKITSVISTTFTTRLHLLDMQFKVSSVLVLDTLFLVLYHIWIFNDAAPENDRRRLITLGFLIIGVFNPEMASFALYIILSLPSIGSLAVTVLHM